ncbi:MAG: hypothetical protein IPQ07_27285 [Myxococcales bacterium]|nr:hypothetical protein [Myxococcales bacterium]
MTQRLASSLLVLAIGLALATPAHADDIAADPNDAGKVTRIGKGVSEIDLGALGVFTYDKQGDASNTRLSMLFGLGYQYFIKSNVSIGGQFLFNYDRASDAISATTLGGTLFASAHIRLGLGAFLRPTLALGALFGNRELDTGGGIVIESKQTAFLTRIQFPFAYFPSKRVVLQAGPEIDMSFGSFKPDNADSQSFTSIAGGFSVGVGYAF